MPITTGIREQATAPLRAYPNPVADHLTVDDVKPGSTWQVLDATGRIVSRGNSSTNGNLRIPMASLTPGTYVLVVNGSGMLRRATVVKD
ncbi:MAG: T9SS type A sorting domain-containing protein [Flavobacteriales bacterium]